MFKRKKRNQSLDIPVTIPESRNTIKAVVGEPVLVNGNEISRVTFVKVAVNNHDRLMATLCFEVDDAICEA